MIGPEVGFFSGGLANRGDSQCVEDVRQTWKFADGKGWSKDPFLKARCEKDPSGRKILSMTTPQMISKGISKLSHNFSKEKNPQRNSALEPRRKEGRRKESSVKIQSFSKAPF